MTLAMRRELKFPADKRFRVKLTPIGTAHRCQLQLEIAYLLASMPARK
ncbi:MAG: hypothetical protein V7L31_01800 [Nostoc sp.]